jgi:hypothetical protein
MHVKGTAFLARKATLETELGADRVNAVFRRFAAGKAAFPSPVLATSLIPMADFLELNDAIVRELYEGDPMSYWAFGRGSAEWALTEGPYRRVREQKSLDAFADSASSLYRNYFTEGRARSERDANGTIHLYIDGIPPQFHHVYFEYAIVGYFERGLEMVSGGRVRHTRVAGFSAGDDHVHYRYRLG